MDLQELIRLLQVKSLPNSPETKSFVILNEEVADAIVSQLNKMTRQIHDSEEIVESILEDELDVVKDELSKAYAAIYWGSYK